MPLLDDALTIWEIGFRWAEKNPDRPWAWIPAEVKDNFRLVLRAIADGDLYCGTLTTKVDPKWPQTSIRHNAKVIDACIDGERYDRRFLKAHSILRWEFAGWCDKSAIPLPAFWFPPGWLTDEPGYPASLRKPMESITLASLDKETRPVATDAKKKPRSNDAIWEEARAAAKAIRAEAGLLPSLEVAKRIHANKQLSASRFTVEAIRKRIADLAPPEFRGKAGRPKAKKSS